MKNQAGRHWTPGILPIKAVTHKLTLSTSPFTPFLLHEFALFLLSLARQQSTSLPCKYNHPLVSRHYLLQYPWHKTLPDWPPRNQEEAPAILHARIFAESPFLCELQNAHRLLPACPHHSHR